MLNFIAHLAALLLALVAIPAAACRGNTQVPSHGHAAGYEVLAVEVTGVRLTSYEWYRAATLKLRPWPKGPDGEELLYPSSSTPSFNVYVLVHASNSAPGEPLREFSLGGCGVRVPGVKEHGLLFISSSGSVGVVWADRESEYQQWLSELGLATRSEP